MKIHYETPHMLIGKHYWRMIVIDFWLVPNDQSYKRCTRFQWRRSFFDVWQNASEWPTYNHNDTFDGIPKSLSKLFYKYEREIMSALGEPLPPDPQLCLL